MKIIFSSITAILFLLPFLGFSQKCLDNEKVKSAQDSLSYCLGVSIGTSIKQQGIENINPLLIAKAVAEIYANKTTLLKADDANKFIVDYLSKQEAKKYEKNIEEGKKFLAENSKKPGVKTLPSGLQYKVIREGTGTKPTESNQVTTHYKGWTINGNVFDNSYDRGEPVTFPVTGVIKGWTEALLLMPVGSKWELYIPAELGYGDKGAGGVIEPYATLIFEVELISIQ